MPAKKKATATKTTAKRKPAAKKVATKKAPAKKAPAKKVAAKPEATAVGAARAEGRKRNREMRDTLASFNSVQLQNFLKGLEPATINRLKKALEKIEKDKVADEITAKTKAMKVLEKQIEELKKSQG